MTAYQWPGNVRELVNAMEHARLLCQTDVILPEHLPPVVREAILHAAEGVAAKSVATERADVKTLEETEIETIRHALEQTARQSYTRPQNSWALPDAALSTSSSDSVWGDLTESFTKNTAVFFRHILSSWLP